MPRLDEDSGPCLNISLRWFPSGIPPSGSFIMEHPSKMDDDWGCPYFRNPPFFSDA